MRKTFITFLIQIGSLLAGLSNGCYAQKVAVKTNLFYGIYARTPNLGLEVGLGKRWNLEANIGAGYVYLNYDKYMCPQCGSRIGTESRNYFGITRTGISIVYIIK